MTRMIPPTIHSAIRSGAERRMFKLIQQCPGSESWICLHSLGIANHEQKRRAEIDFLLLTPEGVFVLEVKGGRVARQDGIWIHTDRFGETHRKVESPFDQASSAMFAIEHILRERFTGSAIGKLLLGYGVLFPDVEYESLGCESDRSLVYDIRDRKAPFSTYVRRLAQYTRARQPGPRFKPKVEHLQKVADLLRGDFDLIPAATSVISDTRRELFDLTREQYLALDAADAHDRLLIEGPAGSGKTVLGIEAARRDARVGRRVLLLCFNRFLAAQLQSRVMEETFSGNITVSTVHAHYRTLILRSSLSDEFRMASEGVAEEDLFQNLFPEYAALAAMEQVMPPADSLVVDEAQDVLTSGNCFALSELLKGGLRDGRWRFLLDGNNQGCVYGRLDDRILGEVSRMADRQLLLTLNCRNTKPIALQTNVLSNPSRRSAGRVEGVPVEYLSYETERQRWGKLEKVLVELRAQRITPGSISVLLSRTPTDEQRSTLARLGLRFLKEADVPTLGREGLTQPTWSTVSAFKGLENDIVVLCGVEDIETDWGRSVTYVGTSRARVRLLVIVHKQCDERRQERFELELVRRTQPEENYA